MGDEGDHRVAFAITLLIQYEKAVPLPQAGEGLG